MAQSRRQALLMATFLVPSLTLAAPKCQAAYIDEAVATEVFTTAQGSVVSLADFAVVGGEEKVEGVGSGVVWDQLGHIITNYHCIAKVANDKTGSQVRLGPKHQLKREWGSHCSSRHPA